MKQIIIVVVALGLIILFNFWQTTYLEKTSKYLLADISYIMNCNETKNFEQVKEGIDALQETWELLEPTWDMVGDHAHMKEINENIVGMKANAIYKDQESITKECQILKYRINTIIESEKIKLNNIF